MNSISILVDHVDQTGEARRRAASLSASLRLDETTAGRVALVVTECANNLWKHAGGGEILLTPLGPDHPGIDVLALDKGPGMRDVARCFEDGYSTSGSAGSGLGAVRRLSTHCQLHTVPGKGTALLARVQKNGRSAPPPPPLSGISVPKTGETECGDDFAVRTGPGFTTVLVVDGLGHGPLAADCASAAVNAFHESSAVESPGELMREIHGALRSTRGAAVAIAHIDHVKQRLLFAGIGNIAGFVRGEGAPRHMVSHPGIVGHDVRNVREIPYDLGENVLVLLYSDGISTHWSLDSYDGLMSRDPALIASVVYRDFSRRRDDATVVVLSETSLL